MEVIVNDIVYNKLSYLIDYHDGIPTESGIYFWNYWPQFEPLSINQNEFEDIMLKYSKKKMLFSEEFNGRYKYKGLLYEQGFRDNDNVFGLSDIKQEVLLEHLFRNRDHITEFHNLFKNICFARSFYIGKAVDLKKRLKQHFSGSTPVLNGIDESEIDYFDIWVGYKVIHEHATKKISNIYEEIFNRVLKPGFTKKPN